jgi:SAM-dependent methyltransferase
MLLSSELLRLLCRDPGANDYPMTGIHYEVSTELDRLRAVFPNIEQEIVGKTVVDFGCGDGYQLIALLNIGAQRVFGIEIDDKPMAAAMNRVERASLSQRIYVERYLRRDLKVDLIISQNSFEHFLEPEKTLNDLKQALAPGGRIYITFAPPWYAPWGAHMAFFCRVPWVHIIFSEKTIIEVRSLYRSDGAHSYRECGLGQMSVATFERVVDQSGLTIASARYDCVRGMSVLKYLPGLRELFINRISVILT